MKSERRHQLKSNTLAHGLETLPEVGRRHGTKILLAIVAALAVFMLVRYRTSNSRESASRAAGSLNLARASIEQLQIGPIIAGDRPEAMASMRTAAATDGEAAVEEVFNSTRDPKLLAEAYVARGDLNWQLATFPEIPGAATQPSLQPGKSSDEYLKAAAEAYEAVLAGGSAPVQSVISARFGLGAIAENRGEWDKAREHYQKVIDDGAVGQPFKDQAAARIKATEKISKPVLLGGPATQEAEEEAATQEATQPATGEAAAPAVPVDPNEPAGDAPKPESAPPTPDAPQPDPPKPDAPAPEAPKPGEAAPEAPKSDAPIAPPAPTEQPAPPPAPESKSE